MKYDNNNKNDEVQYQVNAEYFRICISNRESRRFSLHKNGTVFVETDWHVKMK
jgi:hypothetical protein